MSNTTLKNLLASLLILSGVVLLMINIYGLFQDIRPKNFDNNDLRFIQHQIPPLNHTLALAVKTKNESNFDYTNRITKLINQSLIHIKWLHSDPNKYNQTIPIWDNYFLFIIGTLFDIPEFERYHFTNYKRSLKRGIGICGDAAMVMSQLLNNEGIDNQIISFPEHVVIYIPEFENSTFDPDFGVHIPYSPTEIKNNPEVIKAFYSNAGYTINDIKDLQSIYNESYSAWQGVKHFVTNKYYFEIITYSIKWIFPLLLILTGYLTIKRRT